jgi:hypothetical protein
MELSYIPEYSEYRIQCSRSEYEAMLEAMRIVAKHGEKKVSDSDLEHTLSKG